MDNKERITRLTVANETIEKVFSDMYNDPNITRGSDGDEVTDELKTIMMQINTCKRLIKNLY